MDLLLQQQPAHIIDIDLTSSLPHLFSRILPHSYQRPECLANCHQLFVRSTTPSTRNLVSQSYRVSVRAYFTKWKLTTNYLTEATQLQSKSLLWFEHRYGRLASRFQSFCHTSLPKTFTDADLCYVSVKVTTKFCSTELGAWKMRKSPGENMS